MSRALLKHQLTALQKCKERIKRPREKQEELPVAEDGAVKQDAQNKRKKKQLTNYKKNLSYFKRTAEATLSAKEALDKTVLDLKEGVQPRSKKIDLSFQSDSEKDFDQERLQ